MQKHKEDQELFISHLIKWEKAKLLVKLLGATILLREGGRIRNF